MIDELARIFYHISGSMLCWCVHQTGMLATCIGEDMSPRNMNFLVDEMFLTGLSPTLIDALVDLSRHVPSLVVGIQERLIDMLVSRCSRQMYMHT